jgi:hypothetical protein
MNDSGRFTKNRTFHLLRKGDTSNVVRMGTFLMSVDMGMELHTLRGQLAEIPIMLNDRGSE